MNQDEANYPIDYLSQIAPQAPKKSMLSRTQFIIIGIVSALVLLTFIIIIGTSSGGSTDPAKQLAARLQGTQKIVEDAQPKLKSTPLRTLNGSLASYLSTINSDIAAPLLREGVAVTKLDKKLLASEAGIDITNRLEDARLNAKYDRIYALEISTQLEKIMGSMRQVYDSTTSKSFRQYLDEAITNLTPTQKQFSEFNAANN